MKVFICCLIGSAFYFALADTQNVRESAVSVADKSMGFKQKRDALWLNRAQGAPSYKYLPSSSLSTAFDAHSRIANSYAGSSGDNFIRSGGDYRLGSNGHACTHKGFPSAGNPKPAFSYSSGHRLYRFPAPTHSVQESTQYFDPGLKNANSHSTYPLGLDGFAVSPPHSYVIGHGSSASDVSDLDYKPDSSIGSNTGSAKDYNFYRGVVGSFSSPGTPGFESVQDHNEEYHGDHVHNGGEQHVYVLSTVPASLSNSHDTVGQQGTRLDSAASYLAPSKQHLHFNSYGEPISRIGSSYSKKSHNEASTGLEREPVYAAGHKGLGYFSFTANKPQVIHPSISGLSLRQPSYSKVPFKPSTFLGAKFETSSINDAVAQQYLPSLAMERNSTVNDFAISPETSISNLQSVKAQPTSYLPAKYNQDSYKEVPSASSGLLR